MGGVMPIQKVSIVIAIVILMGVGAGVFHTFEGWSWIDSLYFTGTTLTTIGYGDFVPTTDITKIFTIIFAFAGVVLFFILMSIIAKHYFHKQLKERYKHIQALTTPKKRKR